MTDFRVYARSLSRPNARIGTACFRNADLHSDTTEGTRTTETNSKSPAELRVCAAIEPGRTLKGMPEALSSETFPLETGSDGVIRVRGTRITLDTLWASFNEGATAEEIVQQYPSLSLADVYQAIGYCLRHPAALETYLAKRSESAHEIRQSNESRWRPEGIRARLLERRQ